MTEKKVIDLSEFNGAISWSTVKSHVDGVILRAGYRGYSAPGVLVTDKKFKENIKGAIAQNIPVGIYWLSQAISDAEALAEANYLNNLLKSYDIAYPVYLDSERAEPNGKGRADQLTKAKRTQYGLTFCQAMRDAGYTAGLYCSESWYTDCIDGAAFAAASYEIWIAKYSSAKPSIGCGAWQYTDAGRVSGITGNVDISKFYTDYAAVRKYAAVKDRYGLAENTMAYLAAYKFSDALLEKLATKGAAISPTDYRTQVQRLYGFDDNTMAYLDKWPWATDLYKKLAEAE